MATAPGSTQLWFRVATVLLCFGASLSCQERPTWQSHWERGNAYFQQRDFLKAESELKAALTLAEKGKPDGPQLAQTVVGIGILYDSQRRFDEAGRYFEQAVHLVEQARGPNHSDLVTPLNHLGAVHAIQHHYDKAIRSFERSLSIQAHGDGEPTPPIQEQLKYLAALHLSRVQYEEAEPFLSRVLELPKPTPGITDKKTAEYLDNYTRLRTAQEEYSKAKSYLDEFDPVGGGELPKRLDESSASLSRLSSLLATEEKFQKAERLLHHVLQANERMLGPRGMKEARAIFDLGDFYLAWEKPDAAVPLFERSLAISRGNQREESHISVLSSGTTLSSQSDKPLAAVAERQRSVAALRRTAVSALQHFTSK